MHNTPGKGLVVFSGVFVCCPWDLRTGYRDCYQTLSSLGGGGGGYAIAEVEERGWLCETSIHNLQCIYMYIFCFLLHIPCIMKSNLVRNK